ncbi:MAG: LicD family protein, partial [Synergistaceae bacterium]|nr:LicD family protein [Synergistaceae bacterium]
MRRLEVQELRKIQLEILDVVAKFCDENNINYFLNGGTLLGAIRHKGYIPWDDDIDLGMLRPDYDKFMKLFNENNTRYKFYSNENTKGFFAMCGRVVDTNPNTFAYERTMKIGIYVDIFVFDNAPDDDELVKKMFDRRRYYEHYNYRRVMPIFYETVPELFRKIFVTAFRAALRI